MIPLKDAHPGPRAPVAVLLALIVVVAAASRPLVAVPCALVVFVAADGVALRTRDSVAALVAGLGAVAVLAVAVRHGGLSGLTALGPAAAAGAAGALGGLHVALAPTGRILSFTAIPGLGVGGTIAVPLALWGLIGVVLLVLGAALHAFVPPGSGLVALAPIAAAVAGLALGVPVRPRPAVP